MNKGILPKGNLLAVRERVSGNKWSGRAGQMDTRTGFEVDPENNLLAHILSFSKYTVHMKETQPSAFTGTSLLARCHWLNWGQDWRKEESILFFSRSLKLLMDALPKSLHLHTTWKKWRDCKLMCLLVAVHYLLSRPKDYKQPLITCVLEEKYLFYSVLHFSNIATRH